MRSSEILNSDFFEQSTFLIAFGLFLGAIGYFALAGKMTELLMSK